jgi:hypothetical protein
LGLTWPVLGLQERAGYLEKRKRVQQMMAEKAKLQAAAAAAGTIALGTHKQASCLDGPCCPAAARREAMSVEAMKAMHGRLEDMVKREFSVLATAKDGGLFFRPATMDDADELGLLLADKEETLKVSSARLYIW